MVKVRRHKIELTGEVGQSKRSLKNSNQKDAFKIKNEANARTIIILNKQKFVYEKCNRVIENVIGDRHADVNWAQPAVRGKRLIHRQNGDQKDAFKKKNEANARTIVILNKQKYVYEKCNRVIENVIRDRHANINRAQPAVRGKRLIPGHNERNGDQKDAFKVKNEANARTIIILNKQKYVYEKCNQVIENVIGDRHANVNRAQPAVRGRRHNERNGYQKDAFKIEEKNSDDDTSTEVEILDSDEVIKQGISSAFVPSTTYRSDFGVSKTSSDYRERVLHVLKKPFDKEEFRRLSVEVKIYLAKFPDLKKKLNEHRFEGLTRMTILRGFFYWLQNVMHDEAFKPWEDSQCLAVQPGSGQKK